MGMEVFVAMGGRRGLIERGCEALRIGCNCTQLNLNCILNQDSDSRRNEIQQALVVFW